MRELKSSLKQKCCKTKCLNAVSWLTSLHWKSLLYASCAKGTQYPDQWAAIQFMLLMFSALACSIVWKSVFDRTAEGNEAIDGLLGCIFSIILSLSANADLRNMLFIDW